MEKCNADVTWMSLSEMGMIVGNVVFQGTGLTALDAGTSDDSGRASERINGTVSVDTSHDRLSDVSFWIGAAHVFQHGDSSAAKHCLMPSYFDYREAVGVAQAEDIS